MRRLVERGSTCVRDRDSFSLEYKFTLFTSATFSVFGVFDFFFFPFSVLLLYSAYISVTQNTHHCHTKDKRKMKFISAIILLAVLAIVGAEDSLNLRTEDVSAYPKIHVTCYVIKYHQTIPQKHTL